MSVTRWAPVVLVGWALLVIALERRFPYDRGFRLLRPGFAVDLLGYALLQSWAVGWLINGIVGSIDAATGASRLGVVSGWPRWLQLAFFVVTHDFYIYAFHRLQHHNRWLWRIHEAHHSARQVDWLAGARSHSLEILVNQTVEFGAMVLLGAHPDVVVAKGILSGMWGIWIHSNIDVHTGWLQRVINGPEMHRWHHSLIYEGEGRNFGTKFAFWDWLFGTAYLPAGKPERYGLEEPFPGGYLAQHLHAFRPFAAEGEGAPGA